MPLRKDIWRPAIVEAPFAEIVARGGIAGLPRRWLPPMPTFRFLADPFGLWRDRRLHVFVETYDYRDRVGAIEALVFDESFALIERGPALREPWHLSYPYVFEAEGETWLLPEAHKSGRLTLYRALDFPRRWERRAEIALDRVPIDATPLFHGGLWWLFYASADVHADKTGALHIAWAEQLAGPWRPHPLNPVRRDFGGARPGGTPAVVDGRILLPVQDCRATYGGAIGLLAIETLTPDRFAAELPTRIAPPADAAPFTEGLHTMAAAGPVTLVDLKRTELSTAGLAIHLAERVRRPFRSGSSRSR